MILRYDGSVVETGTPLAYGTITQYFHSRTLYEISILYKNKSSLIFPALAVTCHGVNANDWWLFRGPGSNGTVQDIKLPEENARYWATSAASDGTLFIRSSNTLYALGTP